MLIILPNQLFHNNQIIKDAKSVVVIEHPKFFVSFNFHKLKIVLHRASMKSFYKNLKQRDKEYIEFHEYSAFFKKIKHIINLQVQLYKAKTISILLVRIYE